MGTRPDTADLPGLAALRQSTPDGIGGRGVKLLTAAGRGIGLVFELAGEETKGPDGELSALKSLEAMVRSGAVPVAEPEISMVFDLAQQQPSGNEALCSLRTMVESDPALASSLFSSPRPRQPTPPSQGRKGSLGRQALPPVQPPARRRPTELYSPLDKLAKRRKHSDLVSNEGRTRFTRSLRAPTQPTEPREDESCAAVEEQNNNRPSQLPPLRGSARGRSIVDQISQRQGKLRLEVDEIAQRCDQRRTERKQRLAKKLTKRHALPPLQPPKPADQHQSIGRGRLLHDICKTYKARGFV